MLLAMAFACTDPYEDNITPAYDELPIANLMEAEPSGTYTQWVQILKNTDLFNTMNLDDSYTCFVPCDSGVQLYLNKNGWASVDDIPLADAIYLVKYHTIVGKIIEQSSFDNGVISDTTATGDNLSIEIRSGGLNSIYVNGESRIAKLDISATNGVIHLLDDVITPITETLWEKLVNGNYSIMEEAVSLTGYSDELNTSYTSVVVNNVSIMKKMSYTLFSVSDDVFAQKGINSVADLCAMLGADANYTNANNKLNQFVAYHILDQQLDYSLLSSFPEGSTSQNVQTMASNQLINFSMPSSELLINSSIKFVSSNTNTKNGMMHTLDDIMVVTTPPQISVVWELTDYSDLASLMTSYRTLSSSTSTTPIVSGSLSSVNWTSVPTSNKDVSVSYLVRGKSDETYSGLVNYDALVLNLGIYGWVDLVSPTIISGDYNVSITYLSRVGTSLSGKLNVSVDGSAVGSEFSTHGYSSIKTEMHTTNLGKVSFSETTSHTIRIMSTDKVSTYIDYIKFEPVND